MQAYVAAFLLVVWLSDGTADLGCGNDSQCGYVEEQDEEFMKQRVLLTQECHTDSECMLLCPADDDECDGGPEGTDAEEAYCPPPSDMEGC